MNYLRFGKLLPSFFAIAGLGFAQSQPVEVPAQQGAAAKTPATKSPLRVLLVGHDPKHPRIAVPSMATKRTVELYAERTQAFERFLKQHFAEVTTVFGEAYEPAMSANVDVTLFDTRPKAIDNEKGDRQMCIPADFTYPALLVGAASPLIGQPIELHMDWL